MTGWSGHQSLVLYLLFWLLQNCSTASSGCHWFVKCFTVGTWVVSMTAPISAVDAAYVLVRQQSFTAKCNPMSPSLDRRWRTEWFFVWLAQPVLAVHSQRLALGSDQLPLHWLTFTDLAWTVARQVIDQHCHGDTEPTVSALSLYLQPGIPALYAMRFHCLPASPLRNLSHPSAYSQTTSLEEGASSTDIQSH